tara:strand:- start:1319 stop:2419 length:1101 start_codon:yes stop_codon:yes gene_type:complete
MSKKRSIGKVIFGIWFWPYGIYLIIKHFKNKKEKKIRLEKKRNDDKKKRDNDRRIANKSRIEKERLEKERLKNRKLNKKKKIRLLEIVREFDKDKNGIIDIVEGDDFSNILEKNQQKIIEIDRNYIKQFVQVSNYLKQKRKSLQDLFEILIDSINKGGTYISAESYFGSEIDVQKYADNKNKLGFVRKIKEDLEIEFKEAKKIVDEFYSSGKYVNEGGNIYLPLNEKLITKYIEVIKDDIHVYNLLLVCSINMIMSLINNDMIKFEEIYIKFDDLNMFDSKHERDLKKQLDTVNNNLGLVFNHIQIMGENIISSIGELSQITEESNSIISNGLKSVNSSINVNNLISSVQTYQLYRLGRNSKSQIN